jgi:membrane protein DedA with SNARE-associated domain
MIDLAIIDAGYWFSVIWDLINGSMGYVYVFLFMTIESSFIPFPSEIVVPPAAYVAASSDALNIWGVGAAATLGALAGSIINYMLAMWVGRPIIYRFADSRLGHLCMLNGEKVDRAEKYFDKHGAISTFIGRLIPVIRQLISIPAGLARMNFGKFLLFTAAGAAVWNAVLCWLGWFLYHISGQLSKQDLLEQVEKYNSYISLVGYAIGAVCIIFIAWNLFKPKNKKND